MNRIDVERRPVLHSELFAYHFIGDRVNEFDVVSWLDLELPKLMHHGADHLNSYLIIDWRNVNSLSNAALGHIAALQKSLTPPQQLVLLVADPIIREVLLNTKLSLVAADETELEELIFDPGLISAEEMADLEQNGISFDDVIRSVEALRS